MKCPALLLALVLLTPVAGYGQDPVVRVVVWDEQQPAQKQAYENFLGNAIAEHLTKQPGLRVISANLSQPDKGLPSTLLDNTDVLIWWGHVRHDEISPEVSRDIVARIKDGRLALIALHSAHWAKCKRQDQTTGSNCNNFTYLDQPPPLFTFFLYNLVV